MKKKLLEGLLLLSCVVLILFLRDEKNGRNNRDIYSFDDLADARIAVQDGTVFPVFIKENEKLSGAEIVYAPTAVAAISLLTGGEVDGYALDYVYARSVCRSNRNLMILPEKLAESDYASAFPKDSPYREPFNEMIREYEADGTFPALTEKWLGDSEEKILPAKPLNGENGTLRVAIAGDIEPLCYLTAGGEPTGMEIELLYRFCERNSLVPEISLVPFSEMITMVMTGTCDMAVNGITVTDQRSEMFDFSEPYLSNDTVVLCRDPEFRISAGDMAGNIRESLRRTVAEDERWIEILSGAGTTLFLVIFTILTGSVLGSGLFLWKYSEARSGRFVEFLCAINSYLPVVTVLLTVNYLFFQNNPNGSLLSAALALSVTFAFRFSGCLEQSYASVTPGERDAAISMGYGRFKAFFRLYCPRFLPEFAEACKTNIIDHISDTTLVGMITVMDFQAVMDSIAGRTFEPVIPMALASLFYILAGVLIGRLVSRIMLPVQVEKSGEEIMEKIRKGRFG